MTSDPPVTYVEAAQKNRRRWGLVVVLLLLFFMIVGIVAIVAGIWGALQMSRNTTATYSDIVEHFEHGSIGAETKSGLPYWIWKALPHLFPEHFGGKTDYSSFGFLYRKTKDGQQEDLPIGFSKRNYRGIDLVWFDCGVCHTGTWRAAPDGERTIVPGMPANNLDLFRFIQFVLYIAVDQRLNADTMMTAMKQAGARLNPVDKLVWKYVVIPQVREGLVQRYAGLHAYIGDQSAWGPGRVDTFNPYKLVQFRTPYSDLTPQEIRGASDFPPIFDQRPREGMQLHWDGNNASLQERNLSAAIGAGVTAETVDHAAVDRVAQWAATLRPPPSPHKVDAAAAARGRQIYMTACADCHGYQDKDRYVFEGSKLGKVDPIDGLGTDRGRLDSYTERFRQRQLNELFVGTPYQFKHFVKTNGYANMPLDGLWLRGSYLHNGSVPTLADLLAPPEQRPRAFVRASDVIDGTRGGFVSPPCDPASPPKNGFCYDTTRPGNGNGGHRYGTELAAGEKADLLAYLLTF